MPAYGTLELPPALYQGDSYLVWNNESPIPGEPSERVALGVIPGKVQSISLELSFDADPGVFEVDIQGADTDNDFDYTQENTVNGVSAAFVARVEITAFVANFVRLEMVALTNPVNVTAKITSK